MQSPILTRVLMFLGDGIRLIKFLLSTAAVLILFTTVAFLGVYFYFARDLPDIKTLEDYQPPVISEVFSDDGSKIAEFWTECRIFTPYDEIPKRVVQAFVDAEDARFFEPNGTAQVTPSCGGASVFLRSFVVSISHTSSSLAANSPASPMSPFDTASTYLL